MVEGGTSLLFRNLKDCKHRCQERGEVWDDNKRGEEKCHLYEEGEVVLVVK